MHADSKTAGDRKIEAREIDWAPLMLHIRRCYLMHYRDSNKVSASVLIYQVTSSRHKSRIKALNGKRRVFFSLISKTFTLKSNTESVTAATYSYKIAVTKSI